MTPGGNDLIDFGALSTDILERLKGGPGSGHYGHKGVVGQRGGSAPKPGGAKKNKPAPYVSPKSTGTFAKNKPAKIEVDEMPIMAHFGRGGKIIGGKIEDKPQPLQETQGENDTERANRIKFMAEKSQKAREIYENDKSLTNAVKRASGLLYEDPRAHDILMGEPDSLTRDSLMKSNDEGNYRVVNDFYQGEIGDLNPQVCGLMGIKADNGPGNVPIEANRGYLNPPYGMRESLKESICNGLSAELNGDLSPKQVSEIVHQWAISSNDEHPYSLALQEAAAIELGGKLSDFQKDSIA